MSIEIRHANYYGGGGSKLKATAGEYKALYDFVSKDGHKFIWITDGLGWKTTSRPLRDKGILKFKILARSVVSV